MSLRPLLTVFIFMAASIYLSTFGVAEHIVFVGVICAVVSLVMCIRLNRNLKNAKNMFTVFLCAIAAVTGSLNYGFANDITSASLYDYAYGDITLTAKVIDEKQSGFSTDKYYVNVLEIWDKKDKIPTNEKILISVPSGKTDYSYGDIIRISGQLKFPSGSSNEGIFDYRLFLKTQNVNYTMYVAEEDITHIGKQTGRLTDKIKLFKYALMENIDDAIGDKNIRAVLKSVMFGSKAELDNDIKTSARISGLSHIFAVSGMHISYIVMLLTYLLGKLGRRRKHVLLFVIGTPVLVAFAYMIGQPSVMRAVVMMILFMISKVLYEKMDSLTSISIAGIIVLTINPFSAFDTGFLLSFLATASIILYYGRIYEFFLGVIKIKCISAVISITISAQILTIPVIICSFNTFSRFSVVANLLVSALSPAIFIGGFVIAFIGFVSIWLATLLGCVVGWFVWLFVFITKTVASVPYAVISVRDLGISAIISYYLFAYVAYLYMKRRPKHGKIVLACTLAVVFVLSGVVMAVVDLTDMEVSFLDVGDTDCTVIECPGFETVMIDTSGTKYGIDSYNYAQNVVVPYLESKGIRTIDKIFITHFHTDHAYGLECLCDHFEISDVYIANDGYVNELKIQMLDKLKANGVSIHRLDKGDVTELSGGGKITTLAPLDYDGIKYNKSNENNYSMVLNLEFGGSEILFTGDIEKTVEKELVEEYSIKLDCDILKLAHHGSKNSSSEAFIRAADPEYSVVTTNGEVPDEIVQTLFKNNSRIFSSKENGEVSFILKRDGRIKIKTNK